MTKFIHKIIQVFSDMDFLGWYSTGDSPGVQEITVHQQISDINESPLFLQVNIWCLEVNATHIKLSVSYYVIFAD